MKTKPNRRIAAFLLSLMLFTAFPAAAMAEDSAGDNAAETASRAVTSVSLFSEPQSLKLPRNSRSFWFYMPAETALGENSALSLHLRVTGTLLPEYSSVTLAVNGVEIASSPLADITGDGVWTVPIPAARFKTDGSLNELTIFTVQRSVAGDCADIDNPANWVTLETGSRLELDILQLGGLNLANALSYLFNGPEQSNQTTAEFILPGEAGPDALSAMFTLASAIGAAYPAKDSVQFAVSRDTSSGAEKNRIFVSGNASGSASGITPPDLTAGDGYAAVSQADGFSNLLVSGADAAGLGKAAAFFTSGAFSQLSGTAAVLTTDLRNERRPSGFAKQEDGFYTLADFGYDTVQIAGAFHQETVYTLRQPEGIRGGPDSYLELHFRHAKTLLADHSLLTVLINDEPVGSIQLSASNAEDGMLRVKIPAQALESDAIRVQLECYHSLGKIDCSKDYYDTAWTAIDADSVIYWQPGSESLRPTLRQFPLWNPPADGTEGSAPAVLVSLPTDASPVLLASAAALAYRSGQNSGAAGRWEYAQEITEQNGKPADLLLINHGEAGAVPAEIAERLPIVPQGDGQFTISDSAVTAEALRDKILVQVIRSPWDFSRRAYVVTCPPSMEDVLKQFAADSRQLSRLSSSAALIDSTGTVINLALSDEAADQPALTPSRLIGRIVRATGIPRFGLLIILLCLLIILFLMVKVLSNRRRFTDAKARMETLNTGTGKYSAHDGTRKKAEEPPENPEDFE